MQEERVQQHHCDRPRNDRCLIMCMARLHVRRAESDEGSSESSEHAHPLGLQWQLHCTDNTGRHRRCHLCQLLRRQHTPRVRPWHLQVLHRAEC